jgi:hypothetical protein
MVQDCVMEAQTILQGLPVWGKTSITMLPASLVFVSTFEVYEDNEPSLKHESGFLKACQDESTGTLSPEMHTFSVICGVGR